LIVNVSKKQSVPKLCETRWTARVDTLSTLISKYKLRETICKFLYIILRKSSDSDARLKAGSHLRMIQSSQFIVALVVTQHILSYTRHLLVSQALQKADSDIVRVCIDQTLARKSSENRERIIILDTYEGKLRREEINDTTM